MSTVQRSLVTLRYSTGPRLCEDITHGFQQGEYFLSCDSSRLFHNTVMDTRSPRSKDDELLHGEIWSLQITKVKDS
jgi:hypothetical protein